MAARHIQMVALYQIDTEHLEHGQGLRILHELRNGDFAHAARHVHNGFDEHLVVAIIRQIANKQTIDFKNIRLQVFEIREGGKTSAKVIQTHTTTGLMQRFNETLRIM